MKVISYDTETSVYSKGNPFDTRNYMCLAGTYSVSSGGDTDNDSFSSFDIEYSKTPYREQIEELRSSLESADLIVLFNAKFDLNWSRKYGISYFDFNIWDCQLVHFILTNQTIPYPSLNMVAEYYGLGSKHDAISEYWQVGIQTDEIPFNELNEYLKQDCKLTYEIYLKQVEELENKPHLKQLVRMSNMDTLVLADIEYNGLKYEFTVSQERAKELQEKLQGIDEQLSGMYNIDGLNWNSNDHLSAVLYGGILKIPIREKTERVLKNGTVKIGERDGIKEIELPRLVEPLKRTECAKEGYWKTGEDILKSLKAKGQAKKIIELVTQRSLYDKQLNTYFLGIPKLYEEMHYENELIHGQLNMCVARTGRLSSSKPNMQNFSEEIRECFVSRY